MASSERAGRMSLWTLPTTSNSTSGLHANMTRARWRRAGSTLRQSNQQHAA